MKKLKMLPLPETPDLAIVREFDDESAANILTYQENGGLICWEKVGNNSQTTAGYALADLVDTPVVTDAVAESLPAPQA